MFCFIYYYLDIPGLENLNDAVVGDENEDKQKAEAEESQDQESMYSLISVIKYINKNQGRMLAVMYESFRIDIVQVI